MLELLMVHLPHSLPLIHPLHGIVCCVRSMCCSRSIGECTTAAVATRIGLLNHGGAHHVTQRMLGERKHLCIHTNTETSKQGIV